MSDFDTVLAALFADARARYLALSPDERAHHDHAQRIDFAAGNVALSWPEPQPGDEDNLDKARRLVSERVGPCPCSRCKETR